MTVRPPRGLFVGLAAVDLIHTVDEVPGRNQKLSVAAQQICAGGPATNAAVTFSYLGGRSGLVTAVGTHPLAAIVRDDLERHSVALHDIAPRRREALPLSSIMVVRDTGERTVVSANAAVFANSVHAFDPKSLRGASILLIDGHYMNLCVAASGLARKFGIPVVMDSGSWKDGMQELLRFVDIAICSDDYRPPQCRTTSDVLEFLRDHHVTCIAITRGGSPIQFVDGSSTGRIAVPRIKAVDTLGAGDIFHGAFCYFACLPGLNFRDALRHAARVASFSCRYPGTRQWMDKPGLLAR